MNISSHRHQILHYFKMTPFTSMHQTCVSTLSIKLIYPTNYYHYDTYIIHCMNFNTQRHQILHDLKTSTRASMYQTRASPLSIKLMNLTNYYH